MNNERWSRTLRLIGFVLLSALVGWTGARAALAAGPPSANVVHVVLFFSPTCGHCQYVESEVLPPLQEKYGAQLSITAVDVAQPGGQQLYQRAVRYFMVPEARIGVPTMIVGNVLLVGRLEVEQQLPALIDAGLTGEGVPLPSLYGLAAEPVGATDVGEAPLATAAVATAVATPNALANPVTVPDSAPAQPHAGISGYWLAMLILLLATGALLYGGWHLVRDNLALAEPPAVRSRLIPLLCAVGLGVSGYLAYVETQQVLAICGPVGDCNAVQSSTYAVLLGVPIAVWGLLGYVTLLGLWALQFVSRTRVRQLAARSMLALAAFATAFSIYLTALELFVIRAVCAWCLTSAGVSIAILLVVITAVTTHRQTSRSRFAT